MEKWKLAAIVGLLACLGMYGVIQARYPNLGTITHIPGEPTPAPASTETPIPVFSLKGTKVKDWSFPLTQWTNTPRPLTLKDHLGNVTLIEFWRIGCVHCQETIPDMIALYNKYGPQGLKVVTFQSPTPFDKATDDENNWITVKEFIHDNKIPYPVAFDQGNKLFQAYKGTNYPTLILIDRNGIARLIQTGHTPEKEHELEATIQSELKKK